MQGGYGKRYRIKPRFYLIITAMVGAAVLLLLLLLGAFRAPQVEWGRLASDQTFTAIVLRDEQLISSTEYSELSCLAAEGQQVAAGDAVATLYLSGFSQKDIENLAKLRNDIKDYQENSILKSIVNKGLEDLNNNINDTMSEISAKAISRQTQDLAAAEAELRSLMQQRKEYMLTIINKDETLDRYYQQEANLQGKIDQTRKSIAAPAGGLVSYYLDGYENRLTVGGIPNMTPATVKAMLADMLKNNRKFSSSETVNANQPICRIVNPSKWYAVIVMNARENPFIQDMEYELTFGGLQKTVTGKAIKVAAEGRNELAVLEIAEGVQNMLSLRIVGGHIGSDIVGFRIPVNLIREEENGRHFVAVRGSGANVKRIEVTLLGRDEKYAIVADIAGKSDLAIGLPLTKP